MSQVLIMMCILVFLCIQMLTLENFFLNASFSLAYAYLKIKIFIVHFKPDLHRFLFDTVQIRASLQEMQRASVYSAIRDLKTCPSLPQSSLAREETALRVLVVHVSPVRQHEGQVC